MQQEPTAREVHDAVIDLKDATITGFEKHDRRFDAIDRRSGCIETRVEDLERRLTA